MKNSCKIKCRTLNMLGAEFFPVQANLSSDNSWDEWVDITSFTELNYWIKYAKKQGHFLIGNGKN